MQNEIQSRGSKLSNLFEKFEKKTKENFMKIKIINLCSNWLKINEK